MKHKRNSISKRNVTMYGEFVCSAFNWLPVNKQKENAERMEKMTREDDEIEL